MVFEDGQILYAEQLNGLASVDELGKFVSFNDYQNRNLYTNKTALLGFFINESGIISAGSAYALSDYIPVAGFNFAKSNTGLRYVHFYNKNKELISFKSYQDGFSLPPSTTYIRVTVPISFVNTLTIKVDYIPDSFGLERLRETHQRLNKLSFLVTGLTARLTWAMIGDSYTRDSSRYPLRCARRLWSLYQSGTANVSSGPIGWGYLSFGGADTTSSQNGSIVNPSAVTQSGFVGTYYGGDSPDISVMQSSTAGSTLSWSEDFRLSRSHTLFAEGGSGIISYQATGMSAATQIDLSALPAGIQAIPLTDIPTTNNGTMTITVISGTVKLYGMNIVDASAAGVICHKLGASGSSSADWVARDATRWQSSFGNLEANLTTIMLGTNDQGAEIPAITFKANIITMIDRIRAARPTTDILLVCPQENQRTNRYNMSQYAQAMYEISRDDRDVGFLWLQQSFGLNPADYAYGSSRPWMISDGIHPDPDTGGYAIVAALMRSLGLPAL